MFEELFFTDIKGLQNQEINGKQDGLCEYIGKSNTHKPWLYLILASEYWVGICMLWGPLDWFETPETRMNNSVWPLFSTYSLTIMSWMQWPSITFLEPLICVIEQHKEILV